MAQITLDSGTVQQILEGTLDKLGKSIEWAAKQHGKVTLTVPEPYDHSLGTGPLSRPRNCNSVVDQCGEIGVLIGVFDKTKKPRK